MRKTEYKYWGKITDVHLIVTSHCQWCSSTKAKLASVYKADQQLQRTLCRSTCCLYCLRRLKPAVINVTLCAESGFPLLWRLLGPILLFKWNKMVKGTTILMHKCSTTKILQRDASLSKHENNASNRLKILCSIRFRNWHYIFLYSTLMIIIYLLVS